MGLDCGLMFYRGLPLSAEALAEVFGAVVVDQTIAVRHVEDVAPGVHAFATYLRSEAAGAAISFSGGELEELRARAAAENWSLSDILRRTWRVAKPRVLAARRTGGAAELPADWMKLVAAELSRRTSTALWVCCCDHSCTGAYSLFCDGTLVESREVDDDYVAVPNAALASFAGAEDLDLHDVFLVRVEPRPMCIVADVPGETVPRESSASDELQLQII